MTTKTRKFINVWVLSLGCPKNRVDSERLLGSLGLPVRTVRDIGRSTMVFINTCAFIEPSTRESIRAILDVAEKIKKLKRKPLLAVAGCLPGRYDMGELSRELPEVDLWLQASEIDQWPARIQAALGLPNMTNPGRLAPAGSSYAWLKISEGCRHKCAFCTIPSIRGKLRSEPADAILAEAEFLLRNGVKELVLVGQDVTAWGQDFIFTQPDYANRPVQNLPQLLKKLCKLPGLEWLRLLYLYPNSITEELLQLMAETGLPLLQYFDIPLQHSEPEVLKRMGRPFSVNAREIIGRIRRYMPDAALRSTLIVGYPGETEEQFRKLCEFVVEADFHNLGIFAYQAEEGTPAAALPDQIAPEIREERRQKLYEIQAGISRNRLAQYTAREMTVLVDSARNEEWPGLHTGRVWFQAPEIDGITWVSGPGVEPGAMLRCRIEESYDYDLSALA